MKLLIDENNYEYNPDSQNGVYIIHGFTNSTYEVRELAKYLGDNGFYTRADNLPGHGTSPEDCNRCHYSDWLEFVEKGLAEMMARCDNVYVIGTSMGSVLALHLSSMFPVNAAIFSSISIEFQDKFGARVLTPLFRRLISYRHKKYSYPKNVREKMNFMGYEVWPMSALNEMRKLMDFVKLEIPSIKCPALLMHSKADLLAPIENIEYVYDNLSSKYKEKILMENVGHNIFVSNPDQNIIFKKVLEFIKQY